MKNLAQRCEWKLMLAVAAFLSLLSGATAAQDVYPSRPIKLIAPIAAGGLTDTLARVLATKLGERLGQPVVVDNRAGGGGVIGITAAAKSPNDGYTLAIVYQGVASVNPVLIKDLPYDTLRDFVPIGLSGRFPLALVVNPKVPVKTVAEFVALARSKPGMLSYGSAGNATTSHLTTELFKRRAGIHVLHIPYRGEAPALNDLMGGQVDVVFTSLTSVLPYLNSDRMRVLAVTTAERSKLAPNIPTVSESGLPGFQANGWYGLLAPAGTPKAIVDRLSNELVKVLNEPETRSRLQALGVDAFSASSDAMRKFVVEDMEKWRTVIGEAGIKAD
ncbi:MAG: tripartite tricarboxylate transporter substrate binding protein [Burkholderiaceae bacterium]|nr:tripartite tricarboxylate transporter substrate binding protein [Burkholderiaceae bacterium]